MIFKLYKKKDNHLEVLDEKPMHVVQGYDCFSIYKHSDNSYEWRLCKIVGKEMRPEFKANTAAEKGVNQMLKMDADSEGEDGVVNQIKAS